MLLHAIKDFLPIIDGESNSREFLHICFSSLFIEKMSRNARIAATSNVLESIDKEKGEPSHIFISPSQFSLFFFCKEVLYILLWPLST